MDAKSLAKSKRAHTLHHKSKPKPKPKPRSCAGGGRDSKLPSNWDRYDDEDDEAVGGGGGESESNRSSELLLLSRVGDGSDSVVVPKSKGADYRHLIAEAASVTPYSPSIHHDSVDDFYHGLAPLLSVRGEGILTWIGDDNFVVEDDETAGPEVSFLSLDLRALAEKLAKLDVSKRLFIEPDLLLMEVAGEAVNAKSVLEADRVETRIGNGGTTTISIESPFKGSSTDQAKFNLDHRMEQSTSASTNPHVLHKFEAELDMLLDSLPPVESNTSTTTKKEVTRNSSIATNASPVMPNLDDMLDDLLNTNPQATKETYPPPPPPSKSQVLDDFDSWLDTI